MEEIIYKIEVEDAGASKAAASIADSLNKVDASAGKSKGAIGGFTSELTKAIPGLGGLTTAAKAFIATPIGAVIGAIGLAIGALTKYFTGSEEGQNRFNKLMNIAGVIMEKVTDIIEAVGEKIYNFLGPAFTFIGNIMSKTADLIGLNTDAITGFFNEIDERAEKFSSTQRRINEQERDLIVQRAKTAKDVAELIIKAQEEEGDAKLKSVNLAIALQKQLLNAELDYAKSKRTLAELEAEDDPTIENKKKLAEATAEQFNAEASYNEGIKKLNKQRIDLEIELEKGKNAELQLARDLEGEDIATSQQERIEKLRAATKVETDIKIGALKYVDDVNKKFDNQKKDADKIATNTLISNQEKVIQSLYRTAGAVKGTASQNTSVFKAAATFQAGVDTRAAAISAYKSVVGIPFVGPFLAVIAAAAATAFGIKQISEINSVKGYASGGLIRSNFGTPIHRSNGDNILATVKTGEVILNERHQKALGGASTFARIGVPGFADSGFVSAGPETRTISNQINSQNILGQINDAIRNIPRVAVVIEEVEATIQQRAEIKEQATI